MTIRSPLTIRHGHSTAIAGTHKSRDDEGHQKKGGCMSAQEAQPPPDMLVSDVSAIVRQG
jgi:hypothetical protein